MHGETLFDQLHTCTANHVLKEVAQINVDSCVLMLQRKDLKG